MEVAQRVNDYRVVPIMGVLADIHDRLAWAHSRAPIHTGAGDGVVRIGYGQDSRSKGDVVASLGIRVSGAVHALMVVTDPVRERLKGSVAGDHVGTPASVGPHFRPLFSV